MKISLSGGAARLQALMILAVFGLFFLNAIGILNFNVMFGSDVAFRGNLLRDFVLAGGMPARLLSVDFFAFVFVGIFMCAVLPGASPVKASVATLLATAPPVYAAYTYPVPNPIVPMEYTLLTILILFSVKVLVSYFVETHDKETIISVFGQYVPRAVAEAIGQDPEAYSLALEGEARNLTVFFCDIKNFSGISENLDPRQLARMLNTYFTRMTNILHAHGATIDKYIGDAIMVFWGAPLPQEDHARRALGAAMAIQKEMVNLRQEFGERGWPVFEIGVGINTGLTNVGNMGSAHRVAYTVVGDAVNLAARLEGLTRVYGTDIVVSDSTMAGNDHLLFRELDHVRVRGKEASCRIYQPLGFKSDISSETRAWLARHTTALEAYYAGDWDKAQTLFAELARDTGAAKYYEVLGRRARDYAARKPESWDGISNFTAEYSIIG